MSSYRLGDDVDDFCVKCKRITNHSIVSLLSEEPAKVRCRTCYNDHDWRRCEAPPSKKDLKKMQLFNEVLATAAAPAAAPDPPDPPAEQAAIAAQEEAKPKKGRKGRPSA
ncbi:MAG: hypothetical protein IT167_25875 [Bryobacterales bacterium]|nr:hypothetical protein [Bryobacterales bacterium]MCZ2147519.1 hypothetical protein [Bryobacterales bacterium]